ncbi:hypothetical protein HDV05_003939 [Chytridiales sp. JEL 0842]|nr:hypothetical protein HDV05_003939 [Chytridiales sp. JEL 0842]
MAATAPYDDMPPMDPYSNPSSSYSKRPSDAPRYSRSRSPMGRPPTSGHHHPTHEDEYYGSSGGRGRRDEPPSSSSGGGGGRLPYREDGMRGGDEHHHRRRYDDYYDDRRAGPPPPSRGGGGYDRGYDDYRGGGYRGERREYDRGGDRYGGRYGGGRSAPRPKKPVIRGTEEEVRTTTQLFLGNLPYGYIEADILDLAEKFGPVVNVTIPMDRYTRKNKGFCFVNFKDRRDAEDFYDDIKRDGTINGRKLKVDWDIGKEKKFDDLPPRSEGGGREGGSGMPLEGRPLER